MPPLLARNVNALRMLVPALALAAGIPSASAQPHGELIAWTIARFYPSKDAAAAARTSPIFVRAPQSTGPLPDDFPFSPQWSREGDTTSISIEIPDDATLHGLGRAAGSLKRSGTFDTSTAAPWILGVRQNGEAFGILIDTTWSAVMHLPVDRHNTPRVQVQTNDPAPSVIIINQPTVGEVVTSLFELTGRMEIPSLWSLGIQAAAAPAGRANPPWVSGVLLPCELSASNPARTCLQSAQADAVSDAGQRPLPTGTLTVSAEDAQVLNARELHPNWVKDQSGSPLTLNGRLVPDFSTPRTREWWSAHLKSLAEGGAYGLVTSFDPSTALPRTARLAGDPELAGEGPMAQYQSVLPLLIAQTTWEALTPEAHDRRMLVLTPSVSLGTQRWAGNLINVAPDTTPQHLIGAAINSSLSGQPLVGAALPSPVSMDPVRWAELASSASLLPLLTITELPEENSSAAELLGALAMLRHQLLPHMYTLTFQTFYQGSMVLEPVFMLNPARASLREIDNAYLLGRDLLVVPALGEHTLRPETLPGKWRRLDLNIADARAPSVYIRAGGIIPLAREGMPTSDWLLDPLIIAVSLDANGNAHGTLYEDEYDNYSLFRGQTRRVTYRAQVQDGAILVRLGSLDGAWGIPRRRLMVRVLTDAGELTAEGSERGTIRIPLPEPPADPGIDR